MIRFNGVSKSFANTPALDDLTLELQTAQTTVLLGTSGCGKSTILRLISRLLAPDSGEIWVQDRPLQDMDLLQWRQKIGYMIQEGGLFPHLTAEQNVTLMARHLRWDSAAIARRVADLAALTQLPTELLSQYPRQLSGGQRQRVVLIRALMLDPELLLFDEPLGALDPITRSDLQQELRSIFRELRKTVVFVTHDLGEAAYLADQIVLMQGGRIEQQGGIADLVERPSSAFVSRFVNAQRPLPELMRTTQGGAA